MTTQLDFFEKNIGTEEKEFFSPSFKEEFDLGDRTVENPETLFNKALDRVKGTHVFDLFVKVMHHLNQIHLLGKSGYEILADFANFQV
jgi:hypothetical protein